MPPMPKCPIQTFLAIASTLGFFAVLFYVLIYGVPKDGGDAVLMMLAIPGSQWATVMAYNFSSSLGSRSKENIIQDMASRPQVHPPETSKETSNG